MSHVPGSTGISPHLHSNENHLHSVFNNQIVGSMSGAEHTTSRQCPGRFAVEVPDIMEGTLNFDAALMLHWRLIYCCLTFLAP